ncbi:hypothetical protein O6R05_02410 [Peptoniphilus equinus]|uniref:Poly(3-hydroxyalkanoate) polymerase subunit PhaE n=1 Tax=Peptoniphilus equinus TaxID=3016343 RepID=A0ABY7QWE2_9FIRM|nr:poly(R)-hydroxyalkanoic acid synthase subunit PhaE [Peptoniphilus equinus]WBW50414.1 hypothetical protein O6R05_02410 [Peptoniphilus equinus]
MMLNFYEDMFKMQENTLNGFKSMFGTDTTNPVAQIFNNSMKFWDQSFGQNFTTMGTQNFFSMFKNYFDNVEAMQSNFNPLAVYERMGGANVYAQAYDNYRVLMKKGVETVKDVGDKVLESQRQMKDAMKGSWKKLGFETTLGDTLFDLYEATSKSLMTGMGNFANVDYSAFGKLNQLSPRDYGHVMNDYLKKYEDVVDSLLALPGTNYYKKQLNLYKAILDNQKAYNNALAEYYTVLGGIFKEAYDKAEGEFKKNVEEGLAKDTFQDYFAFVDAKTRELITDKTREAAFEATLDKTMAAYHTMKDKTQEAYAKYLNLFAGPEADGTGNEVEVLKAKLDALTKEVEALKGQGK